MHPFPGLSPRISREAFAELCRALPPPADDSPDARNSRDMLAMAAVAGFRPLDITEALMVVEIVATEAHVREALRLAGVHQAEVKVAMQCRAQAASMMRRKQAALRMLHEYQAARPEQPVAETHPEPVAETDMPADHLPARPRPTWPRPRFGTPDMGSTLDPVTYALPRDGGRDCITRRYTGHNNDILRRPLDQMIPRMIPRNSPNRIVSHAGSRKSLGYRAGAVVVKSPLESLVRSETGQGLSRDCGGHAWIAGMHFRNASMSGKHFFLPP